MYFVYFIQSIKNREVYVGWTSRDPLERLKEHNRNINHWTSKNGPFKLIYYEKYICEEDARSREKFYKGGFGRNIKYLITKYIIEKEITIKNTGCSSDG